MQRLHDEVPAFVEFRIALGKAARDRAQLGLRAGDWHARLHPPEHGPVARIGDRIFTAFVWKKPPQHANVVGILERARHDPDHFVREIRDGDRFTDNILPAAELFLPEIIAENDHRLCIRRGIFAGEGAAHQRALAEDAEIILGHETAGDRGRLFNPGNVIVIVAARGKGFERSHLLFELAETGGRQGFARAVLLQIPRLHREDAIGVRIRQWRHQDGVDDGENGGVRADAEGEREDRDESEARRLPELAKCVTEVDHRSEVRSRRSDFSFGAQGDHRVNA